MLCLLSAESRVPSDHPLRGVKQLADEALAQLGPVFEQMYSTTGRPSVPPESLRKASLLMALYSVRSERLLCEQLDYNLLFRWFLEMDVVEQTFEHSVFSKNRQRLLDHEVAGRFFAVVVEQARAAGRMSREHFTVDGTLVQAWASNTDPEAKLMRKAVGKEAKLSFSAHALMENRNGLLVDLRVAEANGLAEREVALRMVEESVAATRRVTLGADKGYDCADFVRPCRDRNVTPHVAQNTGGRRRSAVDARTTRPVGYAVSQRIRKRVEEIFGWAKTVGPFARTRMRGIVRTQHAAYLIGAAYNLLRMAKMLPAPP